MATMNVHPTVQKYLTILSHALNTAVREYGWLDTNMVIFSPVVKETHGAIIVQPGNML